MMAGGDGRARLRHQLPERFPAESGVGEGDTAHLAEGGESLPVEVEQLVQFHQIAAIYSLNVFANMLAAFFDGLQRRSGPNRIRWNKAGCRGNA